MSSGQHSRIELDCGIALNRISTWLDEELQLEQRHGAWIYSSKRGTCRITLQAAGQRKIASFAIDRTLLCAEGSSTAVEQFRKLFTLRFMSAGG